MGASVKPSLNFSGKAVLITGASAGIGRAAAWLFAEGGARVAVNSRSDGGRAVAEALVAAGHEAVFLQGDVSDVRTCRELIDGVVRAFGRIDILVNNAGIVPVGVATSVEESVFDRAFGVNVKGPFFLSRFAIERMKEMGGGVIVNTASIAGMIGAKNRAVYAASKGAVISLSRALAADHAADNIRVNCVCPGMIESESLALRLAATGDADAARENFRAGIPLGRIGDAREAAMMIASAASDEMGFMTGSVLTIDGGASL